VGVTRELDDWRKVPDKSPNVGEQDDRDLGLCGRSTTTSRRSNRDVAIA